LREKTNNIAYWLIKSDVDEYSVEDWKREKITIWDGVRNFQARNFILHMSPGDKVLFYEARSKSPAVRALGSVVSAPFADPTQFDVKSKYFDKRSSKDKPKWFSVKILFEKELFIPRQKLLLALQKNKFIKQPRLSIIPLTRSEFLKVLSQRSNEE